MREFFSQRDSDRHLVAAGWTRHVARDGERASVCGRAFIPRWVWESNKPQRREHLQGEVRDCKLCARVQP